jgi:hypothetical protein
MSVYMNIVMDRNIYLYTYLTVTIYMDTVMDLDTHMNVKIIASYLLNLDLIKFIASLLPR